MKDVHVVQRAATVRRIARWVSLACVFICVGPGLASSATAQPATVQILQPNDETIFRPGAVYLRDVRGYDQDIHFSFDKRRRAVLIETARPVDDESRLCRHLERTLIACVAEKRTASYTVRIVTSGGGDRISIGPGLSGRADIAPGLGNDLVRAGPKTPLEIDSGPGADTVIGSRLSDFIEGGRGRDLIRSRAGEDLIDGDEGRNRLFGGRGDDYVDARNGVSDVVDCGPGKDEEAFVDARRLDPGIEGCELIHRRRPTR